MTYNSQDLHFAAYSMGISNYSLDKCLWLVTGECGVLSQLAFRQVIEGWEEGRRDFDIHKREFEYVENSEPAECWEDYPF